MTFDTQALVLSFPSPPMLTPCPGPQFTLCTYMFEHPVCMDIQSSPADHMFKCHSLGKEVSCAMHVMLLVNMLASWTLIKIMLNLL